MSEGPTGPVVLFDGMCSFCSGTVEFILRRDRGELFRFAPLQSQVGRRMLESCGLSTTDLDTLVFIDESGCRTRSTAALEIAKRLPSLWPLLYFLVLFPRPLRDWFYDAFARNRYRWFGRHDRCFVPSAAERRRFLA